MKITKDLVGKRVLISSLDKSCEYFKSPLEYMINTISPSGEYVGMNCVNGCGYNHNNWFLINNVEVVDVLN